MAKVRIQAGTDKDSGTLPTTNSKAKPQSTGAVEILRRVLREKGFLGWYQVRLSPLIMVNSIHPSSSQGMGAQITKAVLSQALLFMSKDQFEIYALFIMNFFYRLRSARAIAASAV